jgi:DNA-binding transcriptional ArsR family regulator/anti-anti-sigma regulatory factor
MKIKTSHIILESLRQRGQATPGALMEELSVKPRAVFKQLKNLLEQGLIKKLGKPPKVFYSLADKQPVTVNKVVFDHPVAKLLEDDFLTVSPIGVIRSGVPAFLAWCQERSLSPLKAAADFISIRKRYEGVKKYGLIDGMKKFRETFEEVALDEIFYLDFYSLERFGKTKLGQLLLYAKQSQSKPFIKELIQDIQPRVQELITRYQIDGVGLIPPTVKREVQFMKELDKHLHLGVRKLSLVKINSPLMIPQKTLSKLSDRIENAQKTIVVDERGSFNNILLIDDAVGSGATLNESAKKIKAQGLCKGKIIGLAITGSAKGFDVISEV